MNSIKEGGKHPRVVLAEIDALFFAGIEVANLGRNVMGDTSIFDGQ